MRLKPGDIVRFEPSLAEIDQLLRPLGHPFPLPLSVGVVSDNPDHLDNSDYYMVVFPPDITQWSISASNLLLLEVGD